MIISSLFSLVIHVGTSEDESVVLVPAAVSLTVEQPGTGDGVGTELRPIIVVDVACRSSSLVSHQPPTGKEVQSEVRPSVHPVGGMVVVARVGTKNNTTFSDPLGFIITETAAFYLQLVDAHSLGLVVSRGT